MKKSKSILVGITTIVALFGLMIGANFQRFANASFVGDDSAELDSTTVEGASKMIDVDTLDLREDKTVPLAEWMAMPCTDKLLSRNTNTGKLIYVRDGGDYPEIGFHFYPIENCGSGNTPTQEKYFDRIPAKPLAEIPVFAKLFEEQPEMEEYLYTQLESNQFRDEYFAKKKAVKGAETIKTKEPESKAVSPSRNVF